MTQPNPGNRPGSSRPSRSSSRPRQSSGSGDPTPRRYQSRPSRQPEPPKLSGWQQFLKKVTFGLYDPRPAKPGGRPPVRSTAAAETGTEESRKTARRESGARAPRSRKSEPQETLIIEPETPRLYVGNLDYGVTDEDLAELFAAAGTVESASVVRRGGSDRSKGFAFVVMSSVEEAVAAKARFHDADFKGRPLLVSGAKSEKPSDDGDGSPRRSRRSSRDEDGASSGSSGEGEAQDENDSRERRAPRPARGERSERGERGRDRERRSGGRGAPRFDDLEDRGSRTVTPRKVEVVTTPAVLISGFSAEAEGEDLSALFEGIGTAQSTEAVPGSSNGEVRVTFTEVAEAQRAVELLHMKSFMGNTLKVRAADETVEVTSDA